MAENKYIGVDPEDGTTDVLVNMTNPKNKFVGELVSVNPGDADEKLDVRDLFVAHVRVNEDNIEAYTDNARRVVDISPHVDLIQVGKNGAVPTFTEWECTPDRTPDGEATDDNPYPGKRISLRMRDDGKWVAVLVVQEEDESNEEQTIDLSRGKGGTSSIEIRWKDEELNYGCLTTIHATRRCDNLLGYRLGVKYGLNEGKLLQPAGSGEYLVAEDLEELEIEEFLAQRIVVEDGGTIKLNPYSTIEVKKSGANEANIVVEDNGVLHILTFPAKTGTIALLEDIPQLPQVRGLPQTLTGQTFDLESSADVKKALGAVITALGGTVVNTSR